jgi:hypothetical protein
MPQFDDYISAVTRRLRPDAELQMDIAHELRTHLEDTAEAAHAGGMDEDASQSEAVRAFGDADELADKLFEANRRRMRLRAVLKWAARVTLMPAVLLVTMLVLTLAAVDLATTLALYDHAFSYSRRSILPRLLWGSHCPADSLIESHTPPRSGLTEDELFFAEQEDWSVESGEALVARSPTTPRYHAYYTLMLYFHEVDVGQEGADWTSHFQAAIARGKELEPENALYDILEATALISSSATVPYESDLVTDLEITDRDAFARGIAGLRRAAQKDAVRTYAGDLRQERSNVRRTPDGLAEQTWTLLRAYGRYASEVMILYHLSRATPRYAVTLAGEGEIAEALELLDAVERICIMFGVQSDMGVMSRTVQQSLIRVLAGRALVLEEAGRTDAAAAAREAAAAEHATLRAIVQAWIRHGDQFTTHSSKLLLIFGSQRFDDPVLIAETRRAELSVALRTALSLVLLAPLLGALVLSVLSTRYLASRRRSDGWTPFFSSWRRPPRAVLWVLAVPVVGGLIWFCVLAPLLEFSPISRHGWQAVQLALLISVPIGIAALSVLVAARVSLRYAQEDRALLLFIGWKRLARIMLWSVAAPAAAYAVWLCVLPNPLLQYGLPHSFGRLAFDVALLSIVSGGTLLHQACRAIRERLADFGEELPADRYFRPLHGRWGVARTVVVLAIATLYIATWTPTPDLTVLPPASLAAAGALVAGWSLYTLWQFLRLRSDGAASRFRGTFVRSLLPILIVWLLAAGAVVHTTLRWTERRAIGAINQSDYRPFEDELSLDSGGAAFREHHRELDRRWREEHQAPEPE